MTDLGAIAQSALAHQQHREIRRVANHQGLLPGWACLEVLLADKLNVFVPL